MPTCHVCLCFFKNLSSHINAKHNLNKKAYMDLYPDSTLIDADLSDKFSQRTRKMHEKLKDADPDGYLRTRREVCQTMRNKKGNNFKHSDSTKEKMRLSHTGVSRSPHTQETKDKLSLAKIGKPLTLSDDTKKAKSEKQKNKWRERKEDVVEFSKYITNLSARRKEYILANGILMPKKGRKTSLEKRFELYLTNNNIEYEFQYFLNGKYYDFYIPALNLLVEVDGEYWHRLPAAIKNDIEKHVIAKDLNFKILRITEKEWNVDLLHELDYSKIQQHNFNIINKRTTECLTYELSISMI